MRFVTVVTFVTLLTLPFAAGCRAPSAPATGTTTPRADARWHALGSWSGRGNIQTESFDVTTGALRLNWETSREREPGAGRFRVVLYSSISGRPLQTIVETQGTGAETAYAEDEPRVSYLVIESDHVDWQVTLEEALPAAVGDRSQTR